MKQHTKHKDRVVAASKYCKHCPGFERCRGVPTQKCPLYKVQVR